MEFNFFGPSRIEMSLRAIAEQFDDKIKEGAERVIAKYKPMADAIVEKHRPRLAGKKVMLYVGGLRPRHMINAYEDRGMEIVGAGYEFAHKDDYQRTMSYMKDGTLIFDDVTGYELEQFIEKIRPDLVGSGIKEKYPIQKMGVPFRQVHSWDYSGPYHGYDGFAVFAKDMDWPSTARSGRCSRHQGRPRGNPPPPSSRSAATASPALTLPLAGSLPLPQARGGSE